MPVIRIPEYVMFCGNSIFNDLENYLNSILNLCALFVDICSKLYKKNFFHPYTAEGVKGI